MKDYESELQKVLWIIFVLIFITSIPISLSSKTILNTIFENTVNIASLIGFFLAIIVAGQSFQESKKSKEEIQKLQKKINQVDENLKEALKRFDEANAMIEKQSNTNSQHKHFSLITILQDKDK